MKSTSLKSVLATLFLTTASFLHAQSTQIWSVGTGTWDTTNTNWTGAAWTNGNNATLSTTGTRTGTITVDGGGVSVNNVLLNASGSGAAYIYELTGGGIGIPAGTSTWTIGGATGSQLLVNSVISGSGSIDKLGTRLLILGANNTYTGTTTISAGSLQIGTGGTTGAVAGNIVANNSLTFNRSNSYTYSGVISGTSSVTKAGSGTLILSGANTYAGNTAINAGTLRVDGSLASASVNANTGGTLGGTGTITNNVNINVGGILAPGASPGLLAIGGNLTQAAGSFTTLEIDGLTRGSGYDAINIGGIYTAGGDLTLNFGTLLSSGNLQLFTYASRTALSNYSSVTLTGAFTGSMSNTGDGAWSGAFGDRILELDLNASDMTLTIIPEPSTYALFFGVLTVAGTVWHRRRQQLKVSL